MVGKRLEASHLKPDMTKILVKKSPTDPPPAKKGIYTLPHEPTTSSDSSDHRPPLNMIRTTRRATVITTYQPVDMKVIFSSSPPTIDAYSSKNQYCSDLPFGGRRSTFTTDFLPGSIFIESLDILKFRNRYVRYVCLILALQHLFTLGCLILVFHLSPIRKRFAKHKMAFFVPFLLIFIILALFLTCCKNLRRKVPSNLVFLCILNISLSVVLGVVTAVFHTPVVIYTIAIIMGTEVIIFLFACQHKYDVVGYHMYLIAAVSALFVSGLTFSVAYLGGLDANYFNLIYSSTVAFLLVLWLMLHTQLFFRKYKADMQSDEYGFGALSLFLDLCVVFKLLSYMFCCCRYRNYDS